ncbi:MAG: hypothetical protein QM780_11835 [Hyphomicrobium sp.]|uniref:hypothetical protein n=1 Tax=Hyphomicrobium sp. TaxID=82 RepID=UPI0039E4A49E
MFALCDSPAKNRPQSAEITITVIPAKAEDPSGCWRDARPFEDDALARLRTATHVLKRRASERFALIQNRDSNIFLATVIVRNGESLSGCSHKITKGLFASMITRATILGMVVLFVSACAKSPDSISPAYVSEVGYQNWSCTQLAEESSRLSTALASASVQQENARTTDTVGVILIGLPVSSLSGDNIAPEIARLKGETEAVRKASLIKSCGSPAASTRAPLVTSSISKPQQAP